MSKSLKRVKAALMNAGVETEVLEMPGETRTTAQAAEAAGCALDQIAKSIIFRGETGGHVIFFVTAGGNQVDAAKASAVAGEPLGKADAALAASIFHYKEIGIPQLKRRLRERGLSIRP